MSSIIDNSPGIAKALNDLARHQQITRLYADILADMQVCEVEGWDRMEYINMLEKVITHFKTQNRRERHDDRK